MGWGGVGWVGVGWGGVGWGGVGVGWGGVGWGGVGWGGVGWGGVGWGGVGWGGVGWGWGGVESTFLGSVFSVPCQFLLPSNDSLSSSGLSTCPAHLVLVFTCVFYSNNIIMLLNARIHVVL